MIVALLFGLWWVLVVIVGGAYIAACLLVMAFHTVARVHQNYREGSRR